MGFNSAFKGLRKEARKERRCSRTEQVKKVNITEALHSFLLQSLQVENHRLKIGRIQTVSEVCANKRLNARYRKWHNTGICSSLLI